MMEIRHGEILKKIMFEYGASTPNLKFDKHTRILSLIHEGPLKEVGEEKQEKADSATPEERAAQET